MKKVLQNGMNCGNINLGHHESECDRDYGSVVKRLRHRPFTAVTRVRFPSESFASSALHVRDQNTVSKCS